MSLICKKLRINGMTCINCENRIERKLRKTDGITKAIVSFSKGTADITYDPDLISLKDIIMIIEDLDYEVLSEHAEQTADISRTLSFLIIIISLYMILQHLGILNLLVPDRLADTGMGYGMLFIVGLLTSVHCIAMCGGINLTQCIPRENNIPKVETPLITFRPAFLYNLGRVISYTVIGFILGFAGMLVGGPSGTGVSPLIQGILKLIAGVLMIIMGVNMLDIFPWLRRFNPALPKFLADRIENQKLKAGQPLIVGLLNGLMPCGPLQSMQIIALASGNPITGAVSMFLFSLGTVPLMLGLGSLVSALGKRFTEMVMTIGAVLVVVLGLAMFSQGGSLSGLLTPNRLLAFVIVFSIIGVIATIPFRRTLYKATALVAAVALILSAGTIWGSIAANRQTGNPAAAAEEAEITDGIQVIRSTLSSGRYPDIVIQAGIPVRWVIEATSDSINGCNYKMLLREYNIEHTFQEGENVIEFTPMETGTYEYTCWMGMIRGNIVVTDENNNEATISAVTEPADAGNRSSGCACCGQ